MHQDILLDIDDERSKMAVLEDGDLVAYEVDRTKDAGLVGNIYRGKVTQVLPGLQAAFVDLGDSGTGYLHARDAFEISCDENGDTLPLNGKSLSIEKFVKAGQELTVQIMRESSGDKGPRVTVRWTLAGHAVMLLPNSRSIGVSKRIRDAGKRAELTKFAETHLPKTSGIVIRTAGESVQHELIISEIQKLDILCEKITQSSRKGSVPRLLYTDGGLYDRVVREYRRSSTDKITVNRIDWFEKLKGSFAQIDPSWAGKVRLHSGNYRLFELYNVDSQLSRALNRKVWLKSGGWLMFDYTEAMTVIDVNSGKFTGKDNFQATAEKVNFEAISVIVTQTRLRNLGGIIVIDFIDMSSQEKRLNLVEAIRARFAEVGDIGTIIAGITNLGLVELTRKKTGATLQALVKGNSYTTVEAETDQLIHEPGAVLHTLHGMV